ncbi:SDR family oxidoreductase [Sphingobium lignivorans]|uniref:Nucleoside-diphosphate-sugar epimerase n=1 Tax=Sphingobium lignivorans TaxID=2735886 RepID=A0ABR6NHQ9_9SPHN|nr:SDR family oxidoreductase [Sphingobium lignivorans]MBB5986801.1 nucleoside-diphosphate-sugar epimerase [Sphingobium lignivorans]
MRIFLTGATGFIGSRIMPELLGAGHEVIGLTRSEAGVRALTAAGAQAHLGNLEDLASIRAGAERADAVIHTAFDHDFSKYAASCEQDRHVIDALGAVLAGSERPLLITSAVIMGASDDGSPAVETLFTVRHHPRSSSELAGEALLERGVILSVVRLPQVHDTVKQGLITPYVELAREKGVVAYVGEGENRWSAAHVLDVAQLYRLAVERAEPGARYHAVAEEGVTLREIAASVAAGLDLPLCSLSSEEASHHFGWFAMFAATDMSASGARTRALLGWEPSGPGLIGDLERMDYSSVAA